MLLILMILLLLLAWLWLALPCMPKRSLGGLADVDYAHRGLWNADLPENSLPAFVNAAEHGFGIELDVHLTRDHQLAVIHDDDLRRMCPDAPEGLRVCDCTMAQLKQYHLHGTDASIPTFDEVLTALDGRSPMIVELKTGPDNQTLCRLTYEALQRGAHGAPWCIESFDPRIVRYFRLNHPQVIRGQLAYAPALSLRRPKELLRGIMFRSLICHVLSRPDFVAWDHTASSSGLWLMQRLLRPHLAAWTVRSPERMLQQRKMYDVQIFEGFIPKR